MHSPGAHLLPVIGHTLVIYLFLVLFFRLLGRRQMGQLGVVDLVVILVMGSAVETAMVNGDVSLSAGLVCAATLLLCNRSLALLSDRSRKVRGVVVGSPTLLVKDGHFVEEHLRRIGFTHEDVLEGLRERQQDGIENVRLAVLEVDGSISVIPEERGRYEQRASPDPPSV